VAETGIPYSSSQAGSGEGNAAGWETGERRVRSKKSREEKWVYMRVHYRGAKSRPDYFVMVMEGMPAVVCGMRQIAQWSRAGSLRWLPAKTVLPAGRRLQAPPAALMH
jgi:hypothetical protein